MYSSDYLTSVVQSGDFNPPANFDPTVNPQYFAAPSPPVTCPAGSSLIGGVCQAPISGGGAAGQAARALQTVSATAQPFIQQPLRPQTTAPAPVATTGQMMNTSQYLLIAMLVFGLFMVTEANK